MDELKFSEREEKAAQLAAEIMKLSRSTLAVEFRFLDRALGSLEFLSGENISLATDGIFLRYGTWFILGRYRESAAVVTRDIMHCLLHCVFMHFYVGRDIDRARWDLACDMAVEAAINSLSSRSLYAERQNLQKLALETISEEVSVLSAERIYSYLGKHNISALECEAQREIFLADNHALWYGDTDENSIPDRKVDLRKLWEKLSKRMQSQLETTGDDKNSAMVQILRTLNRTKVRYTQLLQRLGFNGERMKLSEQEFDNNYYIFGLEHYGNIPLIEPLEYTEQKLIRQLVIAIDTSGSVKGEIVQSFIQHTSDILRRGENFFSDMTIHIIQCDDRVREDVVIRSVAELDSYISRMEILGLGNTDFRPVFEYVDALRRNGELKNLEGLIYFTDGEGSFPAEKPPYDTAFILRCDAAVEPETPQWAIRMTLTEDEIREKRF